MFSRGFEYMVCFSQAMKLTFVNGQYQGRSFGRQTSPEVTQQMYDTCPDLCEYMERIGSEGWELVSAYAVTFPDGTIEKLIFKRAR